MRTVCSLLLLCWGLLGCSSSRVFDDPSPLPTGVENTSDEEIVEAYDKLTQEHVQIITMGDHYLISIPSKLLFNDNSPKLKLSAYELLDDVVTYLQSFRKVAVQVRAYSNCYQSHARTEALTQTRAKIVGNYLWSRNIESSIVFTDGMGDDKPIVTSKRGWDSSPNSRVEISFKQVVA